jgi:hypothetical protein
VKQPAAGGAPAAGTLMFPGLTSKLNGLKTVVIHSKDGDVNLDWDGKVWTVRDRYAYPADVAKIASLVVQIAQMTKIEPKTKVSEKYDILHVGNPKAEGSEARQVDLIGFNGHALASLVIGKRKFTLGTKEGGVYVRRPNDPQSWLAVGNVDPGTRPQDWLAPHVLDIPDSAVQKVVLTPPDGARVILEKAGEADSGFHISNMPSGQQPVDDSVGHDVAGVLSALTLDDVAKADSGVFPKDKVVTADFETFEGLRVTLETAEKDGNTWLKIRASAADSSEAAAKAAADLAARIQPWIFQVPAYEVAPLKKHMSDFLKKPDKPSKS